MFDDDEDNEDALGFLFSREDLQKIVEREKAKSMDYAIGVLEELGPKRWYESIPFQDKIEKILNNMLEYFLELEEYEKCALVRDAINYGKTLKNEQV